MTRTLLPLVLFLGCLAPAAQGQQPRVQVAEENLRAAPGGLVLGVLRSGTPLVGGERRGRWREVTVEGWIWRASVAAATAAGYDLQVSASGGENLRAAPNGEVVGRLATGTLLERVEADGRWLRVRRTGWIWGPSLSGGAPAGEPPPPAPDAVPAGADSVAAPPTAEPQRADSAVAPSGVRQPADTAAASSLRRMRPARGAVAVRAGPAAEGAATLGSVAARAEVEVLRTEDGWARVRLEGWVPLAELDAVRGGDVLRGIAREELVADPERYRGRLVEWELRFIAQERAGPGRTEFASGERYLLTRGPGADPGFVYVALGEGDLARVRGLVPLQPVRVLGRVRLARSPLTGAPVLELVELEPRPAR